MNVILLEKIRNLGNLGDVVKVKPGHARNFLIPQAKAVYANKVNTEKFEQRRAELEKLAKSKHGEALAQGDKLTSLGTITIHAKAGEEGKLYGSVGVRDIMEAFAKMGVELTKKEINLPQGAFRTTGEHDLTIDLDTDVSIAIKINIVPEKA